MATLRDVADRAGVSVGAVSRILGKDPTLVIRGETRARVLAAAEELHYRPNRMATGLRTRRAEVIALFLPEPQNLGWADMLAGVAEAASDAGYLVAIADVRGPAVDPDVFARYAYESRVDGVLLATGLLSAAMVAELASRGLPLVAIGSRYPTLRASVTMREEDGAAIGVEHLVRLGHRHIGLVASFRETDIVARREVGIARALRSAGGSELDAFEVDALAERLRDPDRRTTAVIAANLTTALALLEQAAALGLRVPDDLSVIAFDDHPVAARLAPPLTCIRMPMRQLGVAGTRALLAAIDGDEPAAGVIPDVPVLVVRGSTTTPASPARDVRRR